MNTLLIDTEIVNTFSPVINHDGEVVTNSWDWIRRIYGHDNEASNFRMVIKHEDYLKYPLYEILCSMKYGSKEHVISYSSLSLEDAINKAVDEAWKLVNNQGSCAYGIWEDVHSLEETLACAEDEELVERTQKLLDKLNNAIRRNY